MVSKCPGDRTTPNDPEVSWRTGDPRKLYFSLDFKLFSNLELLGAGIFFHRFQILLRFGVFGSTMGASGSRDPPGRAGRAQTLRLQWFQSVHGDRTGANEGQVNRRTGDPRTLYFSVDLKLFSDLEILGAWSRSSSDIRPGSRAIGPGPRAIGPRPRDQLAVYTP